MVLMLRPRSGAGQWVKRESYDIEPSVTVFEYMDIYGNLCQRLTAQPGGLSITSSCDVEVADWADFAPGVMLDPVEMLPDFVLHFLLPSRYCESDKLGDVALEIAGGFMPGFDQAEAIRTWVQKNVAYVQGASDTSTSALDTLASKQGVCRDQTHLGIALCRALGIPARMVVGYLFGLQPMDLHAWFECYIGGRWWTFDPKEPVTVGGRIVTGYGRDATDVAIATQYGPATLTAMWVTVQTL